MIASLDQVFPEYETLFQICLESHPPNCCFNPLPEDLLEIDAQKLIDLLNEASNGRLTIENQPRKFIN